MGHPPEPHGAPAPVGTAAAGGPTATPGLIPALLHQTPWPRWALVAIAVTTAVLMVSCLLCALCCCCHRRRRRKPRDKEAVGLGSARSSTTAHLVQPEADSGESGPGAAQQWGRLQLSLEYDSGNQEIRAGLKQAVDLRARGPGGTADPYARVSPDTQAGRGHGTRVHRGTLCPAFDETCRFRVPPQELPRAALRVQVLDLRRFPGTSRWPSSACRWAPGPAARPGALAPAGPAGRREAEPLGELCVSLRYVAGSGQLTVAVLEARGLSLGPAEPYVKVQLALSGREWKTRRTPPGKGTAAPYCNWAFAFHVPLSRVQSADLVLAVWARGPRLWAEPVGQVVLGARASGQPLQHWADMVAHARRPVTQGHRLRPTREVDEALARGLACARPCQAPESAREPQPPLSDLQAPVQAALGPLQ